MLRRNAAERAISTFKDHFITGMCSTDLDFPMENLDRLLEQAEIPLNFFRPSRLNNKLLTYAKLNGTFDYNINTMPP